MRAAVCSNPANKVFQRAGTQAASENLNYTWGIRINPKTLLSCWAEEVNRTLLVHIILVNKLRWSLNWKSLGRVNRLVYLFLRLLRTLMSKTKHLLRCYVELWVWKFSVSNSCVELVCCLSAEESWIVLRSTWSVFALIWNGVKSLSFVLKFSL